MILIHAKQHVGSNFGSEYRSNPERISEHGLYVTHTVVRDLTFSPFWQSCLFIFPPEFKYTYLFVKIPTAFNLGFARLNNQEACIFKRDFT